jgi:hypothetical protein
MLFPSATLMLLDMSLTDEKGERGVIVLLASERPRVSLPKRKISPLSSAAQDPVCMDRKTGDVPITEEIGESFESISASGDEKMFNTLAMSTT